jgi:RNA polymerase sigma factor (TIGR02999 family)
MTAGEQPPDVTDLLHRWSKGDREALDRLAPIVYGELRRLAGHYLKSERGDHTLQPTALANEAFLRLVRQNTDWESRSQFFGVSARIMRRVLVDHARHRLAQKRGSGEKVSLDDVLTIPEAPHVDLVALNESLERLGEFDEQKLRVVELRYFCGLSVPETAEVLGISPSTVQRDWSIAKAWLYRDLAGGAES